MIIDTAGRLHIDNKLINELKDMFDCIKPDEILYILDSMSGQDAVNSSKTFSEKFNLSGAVVTKMDGGSGTGAILSLREITGLPIKFMTSGENINDIDKFDPERVSRRILGLDDVIGFVEKAQKSFDKENARKLENKIKNNNFDFNDFLSQIDQFNKMGSVTDMIKYLPGGNKIKNMNINEKQLIWIKAIIHSMTKKERLKPEIINGSRKVRIANGSGRNVNEVNKLLKQFNQMKTMMKKVDKMNMGKFPFKIR